MDFTDPAQWGQVSNAIKTSLEAVKGAIGLVRDISPSGATPEQTKAVVAALAEAEKATQIAEAQIAKALGYQLCQCAFPPTAMLTVGQHTRNVQVMGKPVHECPKCGLNTAYPFAYQRIAPPRVPG